MTGAQQGLFEPGPRATVKRRSVTTHTQQPALALRLTMQFYALAVIDYPVQCFAAREGLRNLVPMALKKATELLREVT